VTSSRSGAGSQRWAPDSPQSRYIIAHEFGHRAGKSTTTELLRAAISWRSTAVLVMGSTTMSALLEIDDVTGSLAATLYAVAAGIATLSTSSAASRSARHDQFCSPRSSPPTTYASATVGRDGVDVLATMTVPTGLSRYFSTHPSEVDRRQRQHQDPTPDSVRSRCLGAHQGAEAPVAVETRAQRAVRRGHSPGCGR